MIKLGKYRHFKGKLYEVLEVAKHSESLEDMVVYRALYGERKTWVRPAGMWQQMVNVDGNTVQRFECMASNQAGEITTVLFDNKQIRVENIVSNGVASPDDFWYDSQLDEWVMVSQGKAVLQLAQGEEVTLSTGDSYYIKAHVKHRVRYTSDNCKWLCIYLKEQL